MEFNLPTIYPITDVVISGLSHLEQAKRLIAGGAKIVQIREKQASSREFFEAAVEVVGFARPLGVTVIINDRVDIALASGASGIHLGQDDLSPAKAREILGPDAIIGFSTHSITQAREALALPINYLAIGPVFETKSKPNPDPVIGLDGLKSVRDAIGEFPLVAIGGINMKNLESVLGAGADSVAMISELLSDAEEIESRTRQMYNSVLHR